MVNLSGGQAVGEDCQTIRAQPFCLETRCPHVAAVRIPLTMHGRTVGLIRGERLDVCTDSNAYARGNRATSPRCYRSAPRGIRRHFPHFPPGCLLMLTGTAEG
jgi:hypothetical protein